MNRLTKEKSKVPTLIWAPEFVDSDSQTFYFQPTEALSDSREEDLQAKGVSAAGHMKTIFD